MYSDSVIEAQNLDEDLRSGVILLKVTLSFHQSYF